MGETEDPVRRAAALSDVSARLALNDKKSPLATVSNAIEILSGDPTLAGLLARDDFAGRSVLRRSPPAATESSLELPGPYPRPWSAADVAHVQAYVQRVWIRSIGREPIEEAMTAVASVRPWHPVTHWLDGLRWDGRRRIDRWLVAAFGSPDDDYHSAVGAKFLIAAVRRVRRPGCQFDHMPVFEGSQGIGKSSALRALFSDQWFSDALPDSLGSRDAALGLKGVWCVELAEIEQLIRGEVETIKAFLSRRVDHYRAPYGRSYEDHPRQCVIAGSTNDTDYLRDATGNRRFWPVSCRSADPEWVSANREQLWAEASLRESSGEAHWLTEPDVANDASREQAARVQEDVWEARIIDAASPHDRVRVADILTTMGVPVDRQDKRAQMRVTRVLKMAGWRKQIRYPSGRREIGWERS